MKNLDKQVPVSSILTSGKDISKLLANTQRRGKIWDKSVQQAAMSAAIFAHEHGNITHITSLLDQLPKSARTNALKGWMEKFAPVEWQFVKDANGNATKEERFFYVHEKAKPIRYTDDSKKFVDPTLKLAIKMSSKSWGDCAPEKPYVAGSMSADLAKFLSKWDKKIEDGGIEKGDQIDPMFMEALKEVMQGQLAAESMDGYSVTH